MDNLILIGMPASGKSTIGVLLAKSLNMDFIDTDILIQKKEFSKLQKIIDTQGMEYFLDAEMSTITSLDCRNTVIATGGSVIYREESMRHLKILGRLVFLDFPLDEINTRLKNITTRGIAMTKGKTLKQLFNERYPLYKKYADLVIDGKKSNMNTEDVICEIHRLLGYSSAECFYPEFE